MTSGIDAGCAWLAASGVGDGTRMLSTGATGTVARGDSRVPETGASRVHTQATSTTNPIQTRVNVRYIGLLLDRIKPVGQHARQSGETTT
jgi:hypothetical protein